MLHESGHAVQSFLTRDLSFFYHQSFPSEIAEFAAMSMELITIDQLDTFYDNEVDFQKSQEISTDRCN